MMNKIINWFGIFERIVVNQDGFIVEMNNFVYDVEIGEVFVMKIMMNFNDVVYLLNFLVYWVYLQIVVVYLNIGMKVVLIYVDNSGIYIVLVVGLYFYLGDEVLVRVVYDDGIFFYIKGWVLSLMIGMIKIVDKVGDLFVLFSDDVVNFCVMLIVICFGYCNKQMILMENIIMFIDLIFNNVIFVNKYLNVLNVGVVKFGENWRIYCDCFDLEFLFYMFNFYVLGIFGNWRFVKLLMYLIGCSQINFYRNMNICVDGVFNIFLIYY